MADDEVPPNEYRGVRYWGDGIHDDTAAIQAWIDMRAWIPEGKPFKVASPPTASTEGRKMGEGVAR